MPPGATRQGPAPVGPVALWFGLLGGPLAWSAHLLASYPLVPFACGTGSVALLYGITAVTALVALAAALVALRTWRGARRAPDAAQRDDRRRRVRFMGLSGVILGGFFFFVTLVEGLPALLQDPCTFVG